MSPQWECRAPGAPVEDALVARLEAGLGPGRVFLPATPPEPGAAQLLVCVETTRDVAIALRRIGEAGGRFWPVCGADEGALPLPQGDGPLVLVDVERMHGLLRVDEVSLGVTVQAGATWRRVEALVERRGLTLGPLPAALLDRTILDTVAEALELRPSARYGQLTDAVQGVTAVLPGGAVARTVVAPRRATGPDLPSALLGTDHAAGLLTEVQLQVHRLPTERPRLGLDLPDWAAADEQVRRWLRAGLRPAFVRGRSDVDGGVVLEVELAGAADAAVLRRLLGELATPVRSAYGRSPDAPDWSVFLPSVRAPVLRRSPVAGPALAAERVPVGALPEVMAALPGAEVWELGVPHALVVHALPLAPEARERLRALAVPTPGAGFEDLTAGLAAALAAGE